jgi:hypothetical protein
MITRLLAVAATALTAAVLTAGPSLAAQKKPILQCMTDDGYGRYRPCSALYKRQHPNWRAGSECMTDDGYGRLRPCSQLYWQGGNPNPGQYGSNSTFPTKKQPAF